MSLSSAPGCQAERAGVLALTCPRFNCYSSCTPWRGCWGRVLKHRLRWRLSFLPLSALSQYRCALGGLPTSPADSPSTHPGPSKGTVRIRTRAFLPSSLNRPSLDFHLPKVQVKLRCLTLIRTPGVRETLAPSQEPALAAEMMKGNRIHHPKMPLCHVDYLS